MTIKRSQQQARSKVVVDFMGVPGQSCRVYSGFLILVDSTMLSASFGADSSKMAVADVVLLLEYNVDLVPTDGAQTFASSAAPVKHIGKDAAGHKFHHFALLQRGVISKLQKHLRNLVKLCTLAIFKSTCSDQFSP